MSRHAGATDSSRTTGQAAAAITDGAIAWDEAAQRWYITDEPAEWGVTDDDGIPEVVPQEAATERVMVIAGGRRNVLRDPT